jgi:hypothetical protein
VMQTGEAYPNVFHLHASYPCTCTTCVSACNKVQARGGMEHTESSPKWMYGESREVELRSIFALSLSNTGRRLSRKSTRSARPADVPGFHCTIACRWLMCPGPSSPEQKAPRLGSRAQSCQEQAFAGANHSHTTMCSNQYQHVVMHLRVLIARGAYVGMTRRLERACKDMAWRATSASGRSGKAV